MSVSESYGKRRQSFNDIVNRRDLIKSLPKNLTTPENLARLNATLPPEERIIDANLGEVVLSGLGQSAGLGGDITGEALSTLGDYAVWDEFGLGPAVDRATQAIMSTAPARAATEFVLDFSEKNPQTWENVGNVFNVATFGLGGGLVKAGAEANKGAWAAGVQNYIDNFYGNDKPEVDANELEKTLGTIAATYKDQKLTDKNVALAGKRLTGLMTWGGGGAAAALDSLFNPYSRALYRQTGISRKAQKAVDDLVFKNEGKPTKRDIDKAVAQVTYNRHILEQSDRKGEIGNPLFEIEDYANLQGYKQDTLDSFISGAKATKTYSKDGKRMLTPDSVLVTAYDKINKAWGNSPDPQRKIVFKEPSGKSSGNHLGDIAYKHPANKAIRKIISKNKGRMTTEKLWKGLKEMSEKNKGTKNAFSVTQTLEEAKKEGIWVQAGIKGSAVVEGGVNALMKVMPNGRAIAFMSDKHDFLEKMPIVGTALETALPNQLMAVAGPMHLDIMGTNWAKTSLEKAGKEVEKRMKSKPKVREDRPVDMEVLKDFVDARPDGGLLRGFDPYTGTGLMATTTGGQEE